KDFNNVHQQLMNTLKTKVVDDTYYEKKTQENKDFFEHLDHKAAELRCEELMASLHALKKQRDEAYEDDEREDKRARADRALQKQYETDEHPAITPISE